MDQDIANYQRSLDELARLPFNWDAYGSPPVEPAALEGAAHLLRLSATSGMPSPHIAPISGGWVHLEWEEARTSLQFEVGGHNETGYALLCGDEVVTEGQLSKMDEPRVVELMRWFLRSAQ